MNRPRLQRCPGNASEGVRAVDVGPSLDLTARYNDVRRLVLSCPAFQRAVREGMDEADLLQEILARLTARQSMASRWDPRRSSLGKYVWLFTRSVVSHLLRSHRASAMAERAVEEAGGTGDERDDWAQLLAASNELGLTADDVALLRAVVDGQLRRDAAEVVALGRRILAARGYSGGEAAVEQYSTLELQDAGRVAHQAHQAGRAKPRWEELPRAEQERWAAAARAVLQWTEQEREEQP